MEEKTLRTRIIVVTLLFAVAAYIFPTFWSAASAQATITFYDIGQGDAIHIALPGDFDVLVDAGPDDAILAKLGKNLGAFDRTIDLVVMTHMDADHIAGFIPILDHYTIKQILWNGEAAPTSFSKTLLAKIEEHHVALRVAHTGDQIQISNGIALNVLNSGGTENDGARNDGSIVLRMITPKQIFLLTGDLEKTREAILLQNDQFVKADVLKAGHHGSKTSTSEPFLTAVDPNAAIISAGKNNRYGHPNQETLDRLNAHHVPTRTTFLEADIRYIIQSAP